MKSAEFEELKEMVQSLALQARQSGTPSHVLLEVQRDIKEIKQTLVEVVAQVTKTNGRVNALESWKTSFGAFISGGKSVWIFLATTIGVGWVVFGEFVKKKLGL